MMPEVGPDDWHAVLDDLERRRRQARAMGGDDRLQKHRAAGKLDARARIDHLLDPASFVEIGTLVGGEEAPADAIVIGSGTIDGRPVLVGAEDFTVKAGTISGPSNSKRHRIAELAVTDRVPLVMILEGAGFRADGRPHGHAPTDLLAHARCSGRIPLVTAVLGPSAGHGALVAPMSDFVVMSRQGSIFTAGPPVVHESLGETVTKEDLGGPAVALASGLVHNAAGDDAGALDLVRAYLGYFPSSAWSYPPFEDGGDDGPRALPELLEIIPRSGRQAYDMRLVCDAVFDAGSCFEVQPDYGPSTLWPARPARRPPRRRRRQPAARAGRVDRCRRRREGCPVHHGRGLVPPAARVPVRQPRGAARAGVGAGGHPAQGRPDVRGRRRWRPRRSSRSRCARPTASARWSWG